MYSDSELHQTPRPSEPKRQQKFLRFEIQERDRKLLSSLSEEHRSLLLASGSYNDMAAQFGIPLGTVRSRLHRARATLELLRQDSNEVSADQPAT
jgi:DNA-directed RNA polymerase specialized sigma24 family protein